MAAQLGTVLNVHGDGATRAAVARLLGAEGLPTRDVATADEARDALRRPGGCADLVLLDAGLDGAEPLCRDLRGGPEEPPPVLLTLPPGLDPAPGLAVLADDVLDRPPDPARWVASIRAWVRVGTRLCSHRAEAARWRSLFEALEEGVALVDSDGVIRSCNRAMAALLGAEPGALVGARLADRATHLIPPGRPWPAERALRGGGRIRDEWEAGRRWLRSTAAPLRESGGRLGGVVATLEDVTAEVHLRQRVAQVEAEARTRADRIEQLERDARLHQVLSGLGERADGPPARGRR